MSYLNHDVQRFKQEWLHSITPIKGLYLTGQDIISGGVGGALVGGMMTTSAMMGKDAMKVMKLLKDWRPADEGTSTTPTAPGKTPG